MLKKYTPYLFLLLFSVSAHSEERFKIFGHYSQAYAISSGETVFGIPSEGTFDYRSIGLQFNFNPSEKNRVSIQTKHRRIGRHPIMGLSENLEFDWGFYQRNFSDNTWIKAGRILRPFGIYSEINDVGVLLPFYQATYTLYFNNTFTSKVYDGIAFYHLFEFQNGWSLSMEVFAGEYKFYEWYVLSNFLTGERIELVDTVDGQNSWGFWNWLNVGQDGTRLGFGLTQADYRGGIQFLEEGLIGPVKLHMFHGSIDYTKDTWFARAEGSFVNASRNTFRGFGYNTQYSIEFIQNIRLNLQYEYFAIRDKSTAGFSQSNFDFQNDAAIGFSYNHKNLFNVKLEGHWNNSVMIQQPVVFINDPRDPVYYMIFSVSGAF